MGTSLHCGVGDAIGGAERAVSALYFDPQSWLERLAIVGGHAWLSAERLYVGWMPRGKTLDDLAAARAIFAELDLHKGLLEAVEAHLSAAIQRSLPSTTVTGDNYGNEGLRED